MSRKVDTSSSSNTCHLLSSGWAVDRSRNGEHVPQGSAVLEFSGGVYQQAPRAGEGHWTPVQVLCWVSSVLLPKCFCHSLVGRYCLWYAISFERTARFCLSSTTKHRRAPLDFQLSFPIFASFDWHCEVLHVRIPLPRWRGHCNNGTHRDTQRLCWHARYSRIRSEQCRFW